MTLYNVYIGGIMYIYFIYCIIMLERIVKYERALCTIW